MTKNIYPKLSDHELAELQSSAEAKFYRACRDFLSDDVLVVHSLSLFTERKDGGHSIGECDFVLFDPDYGVQVVEVKGGGISYAPEKAESWYSIDRHGVRHQIKDPFKQSEKYRFRVLDLLRNTILNKKNIHIPAGHSVAFPDLSFSDLKNIVSHNRPRSIIACSDDLDSLGEWYKESIKYWHSKDQARLGKENLREISRALLKPVYAVPTLAFELENLEKERILLTDAQSRLLLCLGGLKQANIIGGAGTGKTVVARTIVEKLTSENHKTAFICYNRALGESFRSTCSKINHAKGGSYHSFFQGLLGDQFTRYFNKALDNFTSEDEWDVVRPFAYALFLEDNGPMFDAIVIDEAQDFKPDYWLAIELLAPNGSETPFFVFSDTNQQIFSNSDSIPRLSADFLLYANCRNTKNIHTEAYETYKGPAISPPALHGDEVTYCSEKSMDDQKQFILNTLNYLISDKGAKPSSIFILVAKSSDFIGKSSVLEKSPNKIRFNFTEFEVSGSVGVSTVKKFKGLESDIVFVWGLADLPQHEIPEMRYVALSRAKSILYVVN